MNRIITLVLYLGFALVSCTQSPQKKRDRQDILKNGSELFAKYGCAVCHSLEGKVIYGPPLNNIYMKEINVIRKGKEYTIIADREYLKKAISEPRYEKVLEYRNKEMPLANFSVEETEILVDYLISLSEKTQAIK